MPTIHVSTPQQVHPGLPGRGATFVQHGRLAGSWTGWLATTHPLPAGPTVILGPFDEKTDAIHATPQLLWPTR